MNKKECRLLFRLLSNYIQRYESDLYKASRRDGQGRFIDDRVFARKFYKTDLKDMEQFYDALDNNCVPIRGLLNPQASSSLGIKRIKRNFGDILK